MRHQPRNNAATFDASTEGWTTTGDMPLPGSGPRVLLTDGTVLATAGSGAHCDTGGIPESDDDCGRSFIYDPGNRTWSETGTMTGIPRYGYLLTALLDDTVLASGGVHAAYSPGPLTDAAIYTP